MSELLSLDEKPSIIMMQTVLKNDPSLPPSPMQTLRSDIARLFGVQKAENPIQTIPGPMQTIVMDLYTLSNRAKQTFIVLGGCLFFYGTIPLIPSWAPAPDAKSPASVPTMATSHVAKKIHHAGRGTVVVLKKSLPANVLAHHLFGQDYSLTWDDIGPDYSYHIYYSNDPQMVHPQLAFNRPVAGAYYRFTIDGNAKNVWMAVAPIDAQQHEGALSDPQNIGEARS